MKKFSILAIVLGLVVSPLAIADNPESKEGVNAGQAEKQSWWQERKARSQAKRAERQALKAQEEAAEKAAKEEKARLKAQKKAEKRAAEEAAKAQKKAAKEAKKSNSVDQDAAKAQKEARKQADKQAKAALKAEKKAIKRADKQAKLAAKAEAEALEEEKKALKRAEKEALATEKVARKAQPKLSKAERRTQMQLYRLNEQIKEFDQFAADEVALEKLQQAMWRHYSISSKRFEARLETFPHLSVGEMFVATMIARNAGKNIEDIIESNYDNRPWSQMALQYHVSLNQLIDQSYKVAILVRAHLQALANPPEEPQS